MSEQDEPILLKCCPFLGSRDDKDMVHNYPSASNVCHEGGVLPPSWGPAPPHIVVMRIVGIVSGILFLIYGQWLYSKLHRAREKLSHGEQLYRRIIETSPDGIILSAPDAHIVMANQKAAECLGYDDVRDLTGKNPFSLVSPSERERAEAGIEALLAGGLPKKTEYLVLQKDGRAVPLEVTSYKATEVDGLATAVISVLRDVSDRRQLERRVLEACEGEQRRIGQELHDSICSELSGMGFMADAARKSFEQAALPAQRGLHGATHGRALRAL